MSDRDQSDFEVVEFCGRLSCRKPIVQTAGRGRRKEFCSETCRRAADRDYKRVRALVDSSERQLRNFRHEVAAYGRKTEADEGVVSSEEQAQIRARADAAMSRAQALVEFAPKDGSYLHELQVLLDAVRPLLAVEQALAIA